jgi:hypothetical protein
MQSSESEAKERGVAVVVEVVVEVVVVVTEVAGCVIQFVLMAFPPRPAAIEFATSRSLSDEINLEADSCA